jgi:DNA invertase Pin-like site-specific DNA recombinase
MTSSTKVVQYARVERYAVSMTQNGSPTTVDVVVVYNRDRLGHFVLDHKIEINIEQLRALLEVLRRIGIDPGGGQT